MPPEVDAEFDAAGNLVIYLRNQEAVDWFDNEIYYKEKDPPNGIYISEWQKTPEWNQPVPPADKQQYLQNYGEYKSQTKPTDKIIAPKLKGKDLSRGLFIIEKFSEDGPPPNSPPDNKVCPCKLNPNAAGCENP